MALTPEPKPSARPSAIGPAMIGQFVSMLAVGFTGKPPCPASCRDNAAASGVRSRRAGGELVAKSWQPAVLYQPGMSAVHLVCGPVGAGKTTFSRRLERERRALRLSVDE